MTILLITCFVTNMQLGTVSVIHILWNMAFLRWTFSKSSLTYIFNCLRDLYKYATRDGPSIITRSSKYGFPLKFKAFLLKYLTVYVFCYKNATLNGPSNTLFFERWLSVLVWKLSNLHVKLITYFVTNIQLGTVP